MFLDTCFLIDLLRESGKGIEGPATQKLNTLASHQMNISLFTACELMGGAEKSLHPADEKRKVELLVEHLRVVYPETGFEVIYAEIYADLSSCGTMIPQMDLLIGTQAKMLNMPLITRDIEHFSRIRGLVIEPY
ncbi:MAG: hypothetical protein DRZ90_03715 [Spirochaetes bacterium]|nr:MAG: hypothetical protein DRZ90_03715 [Spirochaetota bacterium]